MQYDEYIRKRITQLRLQKNISEYKLSHELGHGDSYIRGITSGKSLPSMKEFLYICEYFEITPKEFFDDGIENPMMENELLNYVRNADSITIKMLMDLLEHISKPDL